MDIKTIYFDNNIIKSHHTIVTDTIIRDKQVLVSRDVRLYMLDNKNSALRLSNVKCNIVGLEIESDDVSDCYVCIYNFVISHFHVTRGNIIYHLLILQHYYDVTIIIDRQMVTNLKILGIKQFECNIYPHRENGDPTHIIVKINEFSPNVTYHHYCKCVIMCSFACDKNIFDYDQYLIQDVGITKLHPAINAAKFEGISKRMIVLLRSEFMINDILIHIGTVMFFCI